VTSQNFRDLWRAIMAQVAAKATEAVDLAERTRKFDIEVKRVAVLMCEEMDLDPYEIIVVPENSTRTPYEVRHHYYVQHDTPLRTRSASRVQRWESFRPDAARAIAGWRAVHKYVLTET
jgi:hypothetical protein